MLIILLTFSVYQTMNEWKFKTSVTFIKKTFKDLKIGEKFDFTIFIIKMKSIKHFIMKSRQTLQSYVLVANSK